MVTIISQGVVQHPGIARQLGKDPKVGNFMLDLTFPDGPPPMYSRKGIEIGPGFVAISEQRISADQQKRTERLLWPSHMLDSIYAYHKTLWSFQYRKLKQALGIESKVEPGSFDHRADYMLSVLQAHQVSKEGRDGSGVVPGPSTATTKDSKEKASAAAQGERPWYLPSMKPSGSGESLESVIAASMFAHTLQKGEKGGKRAERPEPPRGTFVVAGLVQMRGSRAAITFDVQAFYDPKASRYTTINIAPKTIKRWVQPPRGGA